MYLIVRKAAPHRCINLETHRDFDATKYMQRQPTIMPNYGRKSPKLGVPKTSLSRVLLYDNITQQQMLDVKLANIQIEQQRAEYLMNMHKRSFSLGLANKRRKQLEYQRLENAKTQLPELESTNNMPRVKKERSGRRALSVPNTPQMVRRISTFSLSSVKLPPVGNHKKQVLLKINTKSGKRRIFHTYDENGIFVDVVPIQTFYKNIVEEPRFQNLEMALELPTDFENTAGFVILSPSYEKHYPKVPTFLLEDHEDDRK